jgi:hypothetical protein
MNTDTSIDRLVDAGRQEKDAGTQADRILTDHGVKAFCAHNATHLHCRAQITTFG